MELISAHECTIIFLLIWIDRCTKINFVYNTTWDKEICIAKGTLSKGVNIQGLDIDSNI